MQSVPDMIQRAASFDWEALLPVAFFLLYGLSQLFGNKKKKPGEEDNEKNTDASERARQIREEIRRKIEQRKQAPARGRETPEYDPTRPDGQQRAARPQQSELQPQQSELRQPRKALEPKQTSLKEPVYRQRQEASGHVSIEEQLQEQRRLLEETRRKAQEARERVAKIQESGRSRQMHSIRQREELLRVKKYSKMSLRGNLLLGLRNPRSIREAVLYREILGKPIGLK